MRYINLHLHYITLHVPKNKVFGGFESADVKILSSNPQRALPSASFGVSRVKIGSTA